MSEYGYLVGTSPYSMSNAFMQSLHQRCKDAGCQLPQAIALLKAAEQVAKTPSNESMKGNTPMEVTPVVLYCEFKGTGGEHPFPSKRGYVSNVTRVTDPNNPTDESEQRIFCLPHASTLGLYHGYTATAQIEGDRVTVDREEYERYQAHLEQETFRDNEPPF